MAYVLREIGSDKTWDAFVQEHSPMALFQGWEWGEVEKKLGSKVWRWGWFKKDILVGIAQIIKVSARRGTFLHLRHGPIGDVTFKDIVELAKKEHAWFIRVSPQLPPANEKNFRTLGFVSAPIHAMDAELCWVLDLDKSEEELLAGMRKTTRYEIKRAQKLGVSIKKTHNIHDFLELYKGTSDRQGFVPHSGIQEELEVFGEHAIVYNATHEGKTLASAIILILKDTAIYHHGASVPGKIPASYLIQWEAICEAKRRGQKLYNFWGIAPENKLNHPWRGITLFKKGFGGRELEFTHAQDYPVSPLYVIPKTIEGIRKRLKGY
jgi:peptidoglycan pentaglycine glycine transferase (the first glycine)